MRKASALLLGFVAASLATVSAAPLNDDFSNAALYTIGTTVTGNTVSATLESGESSHLGQDWWVASVWYKFRLSGSNQCNVTISVEATEGSNQDSCLVIATGTSVEDLVYIVFQDTNTDERFTGIFDPGKDYYIGIYSYALDCCGEFKVTSSSVPVRNWYCAPGGTGSGSSAADPTSLKKALDSVVPGKSVFVAPGTYLLSQEGVPQSVRWTDGTYIAVNTENVAIVGAGSDKTVILCDETNDVGVAILASGVSLKGVRIEHTRAVKDNDSWGGAYYGLTAALTLVDVETVTLEDVLVRVGNDDMGDDPDSGYLIRPLSLQVLPGGTASISNCCFVSDGFLTPVLVKPFTWDSGTDAAKQSSINFDFCTFKSNKDVIEGKKGRDVLAHNCAIYGNVWYGNVPLTVNVRNSVFLNTVYPVGEQCNNGEVKWNFNVVDCFMKGATVDDNPTLATVVYSGCDNVTEPEVGDDYASRTVRGGYHADLVAGVGPIPTVWTRTSPAMSVAAHDALFATNAVSLCTVGLIADATGTVQVVWMGNNHVGTNEFAIASSGTVSGGRREMELLLAGLTPGRYDLAVSYSGDVKYFGEASNVVAKVYKLYGNIHVVAHDVSVADTNGVMFSVLLPADATGELKVSGAGLDRLYDVAEAECRGGCRVVEVRNRSLPYDRYVCTFSYSGDGIYYVADWDKTVSASEVLPLPPVVSNVSARQRWPWNGLVDIDYEVVGEAGGVVARISVTNAADGAFWTATSFIDGAAPTLGPGRCRATWNAPVDGATNVVSDAIAATVSLVQTDWFGSLLYVVVGGDGKSAERALLGRGLDGKYQGVLYLDGEFRFRSSSNTRDVFYGFDGLGRLSAASTVGCPVSEAGVYLVAVDLLAGTYELSPIESVTMAGSHNDWNDADPAAHMTYAMDEGCWRAERTFAAQTSLKFVANDGGSDNWGAVDGGVSGKGGFLRCGGEGIAVPAGRYLVRLFLGREGECKAVFTSLE